MIKKFKILLFSILLFSALWKLEFSGYLYHTDILSMIYKTHGIDVSHHQYRINWRRVDKRYKFVIMKATEGQNFLDRDFFYNWSNARLNGFTVGAYHFFSMLSKGSDQADFYISIVPKSDKTLPPVIDVEVSTKLYSKDRVLPELKDMVEKLEKHYKKKVIFYVNNNTYNAFLKGEFVENKIWFSDFKFYPRIEEKERLIMWQYSRLGRVRGIDGHTDKNALIGTNLEELIENSKID